MASNHNADLSPSANPHCTQNPVVCTITMLLAPGAYTATFATYDGPLRRGNAPTNPPTGRELSADQDVPLRIAAGQANVIDVTLDGIPATVALVASAGSTITGNMTVGFTVAKCGSASPTSDKVTVLGTDADGSYILGPGAPASSLSSSDPALIAIGASEHNAFRLTHPISSAVQGPVELTATVTPLSGARAAAKTATVSVTISGGAQICGVFTEFAIPTSRSNPKHIVAGPDGNLWFTEAGGSRIGKITTAGRITEFSIGVTTDSQPNGIAAGTDGNLWFTETSGNRIGRITTAGTITEFSAGLTPGSYPRVIAAGHDGNLWFTESSGNRIGKITPLGTIAEYSTGIGSGGNPFGIAAGPDGNLWFTDPGVPGAALNRISKITTDGSVTEYTVPTSFSDPNGIVAGPDGNLWFTECSGNRIGKIAVSGTITEYANGLTGGSDPYFITAGPDGNLWFTEFTGNRIGSITTAGAITEYPIPTASSYPHGIEAGPDGSLWFSAAGVNSIARLQ